MKLALLSDIHANSQALEACLAHAHGQGADQFAILGDLVGYGADPVAVVQQVQALVAKGAMVIKGNHDAMAVTPPADSHHLDPRATGCGPAGVFGWIALVPAAQGHFIGPCQRRRARTLALRQ